MHVLTKSKSNNTQRSSYTGRYIYYLLATVNRKLVFAVKTLVMLRRGIIKSETPCGVIATTFIGFTCRVVWLLLEISKFWDLPK